MPLTRSAASGNKIAAGNGTDVKNESKEQKLVKSKRVASEIKVDSPPKKIGKKAGSASNGKSKTKRGLAGNKKSEDVEPELEESTEDDLGKEAETIYEFTAKDIKGSEVSLGEKYKGHVCVIVNVASKCGHTKSNYEQFVEIFDKYSEEKGLRILAFPCNQFGKQEPADNTKICEFAEKRNVKFDMFEKIDVNGKNAHPLWKFLTNKINGPKGKAVAWNFTKFIIDKEGKVVERHASTMKPLKLVENLEKYW